MPKQVMFQGQLHSFPDNFTDAQISEALASVATHEPAAKAEAPSALEQAAEFLAKNDPMGETVGNLKLGAIKGLGTTAVGVGQLLHKIPGLPSVAFDALGLTDKKLADTREALKPKGGAQKTGFTGEQIGEFFVPGLGEEAAAAKAPSVLARIIPAAKQAVAAGAIGAAQEGNVEGGIAPAAWTAASPLVGAVVKRAAEVPLRKMIRVVQPTTLGLKDAHEALKAESALRGFNGVDNEVVNTLSTGKSLGTRVNEFKERLYDAMDEFTQRYGMTPHEVEELVKKGGVDEMNLLDQAVQEQIKQGRPINYNTAMKDISDSMKRINALKEAVNVVTRANIPKGAGVLETALPYGLTALATSAFNPGSVATGLAGLLLSRSPRAAMTASIAGRTADKALSKPGVPGAVVRVARSAVKEDEE